MNKIITIKDITVCAVFGALMFASKLLTEVLPNIHLISVILIALTVVYRSKALLALYTFVFISGLYYGFPIWWLPYLYIWLPLVFAVLALPKNMKNKTAAFVYPIICGLHGLLFGTLYAPSQALLFGLDFKGMISWIIAGLPYDLIHALGNVFGGMLVLPLVIALRKVKK